MDTMTKKNCLSVADFNNIINLLDEGKLTKAFDILINRSKRLSDLHFAQSNNYKSQMYDFIIRDLLHNYFYQHGKKRNELNFDELISEVESHFKDSPYYISKDIKMFTDHKHFKELNVFSKVVVDEQRDRALNVKSIQNGYAGKAGVYFTVYETPKVYSIDDIVEIDNR